MDAYQSLPRRNQTTGAILQAHNAGEVEAVVDDSVILEHLIAIRAKVEDVGKVLGDVEARLYKIDTYLAGMRRDLAKRATRPEPE